MESEDFANIENLLDIRMFGCKCDAKYYDSLSEKWYQDCLHTKLATDDSESLQKAINSTITSTWLKIPNNICLNSPVKLRHGIHIIGNSSAGYGWTFNETMVVTNADILDRFFYYNGDGITDSWHHATISYLRLDGFNKVEIGIDIPSAGECSEIHNIMACNFTKSAIRYSGECATGTIRNVSLMFNNYGLLVENGRHTLTIDGISGDRNINLIRFKDCLISLGCTITGLKSEATTSPVIFENCNGGAYTFIGGSAYGTDKSVNFIEILGFSVNKQSIVMIGVNPNGSFLNVLKDNSIGGQTILNSNGQNGIITYCSKTQLVSAKIGGESGLCIDGGLYLRKWDGTNFIKTLTTNTGAETLLYSQSATGGLSLVDNSGIKQLRIGKGSKSCVEILNGVSKPVKKVNKYVEFSNLDNLILANATTGNFSIKGANINFNVGFEIVIKKVDSTVNTVTISMLDGKLIEGALSVVLNTQWQFVRLVFDGVQWVKL